MRFIPKASEAVDAFQWDESDSGKVRDFLHFVWGLNLMATFDIDNESGVEVDIWRDRVRLLTVGNDDWLVCDAIGSIFSMTTTHLYDKYQEG